MEFLFLEITDIDANAFICDVSELLSGKRPRRNAHLTVRGPYEKKVPLKAIESCEEKMKFEVLRINSVGTFSNIGEEVLYLRVDSPKLRTIWWKPDYPIKQYGYSPHISLYRGRDTGLVKLAYEYLKSFNLNIPVSEFRLLSHRPGESPELFSLHVDTSRIMGNRFLSNLGVDFMDKFHEIINDYRVQKS